MYRYPIFTILLILGWSTLTAQSAIKQYELQKGEILDVLLIQQHPDKEEELQEYFEVAFPVAMEMSYTPLPGLSILELTQGNHLPSVLVFGKWDDRSKRENFLERIVEAVPDFHERRRSIWSYFGLTYFELEEDLSFEINPDNYYVATAFWEAPETSIQGFTQEWGELLEKHQGTTTLSLTNGTSPTGYYYQPDWFVITSWESEAAFHAFHTESLKLPQNAVRHVNQFVIQ